MSTHDIRTYGATGDGKTLDTRAIQQAIDTAHAAGGGTVLVPAGSVFLTGTFQLKSHVTLHLENGSRLIGSEHRDDYPNPTLRCLIEAFDATSIAITGMGVIDGRAKLHMADDLTYIYEPRDLHWRPRLIGLIGCTQDTIRDITLADSANRTQHLTGSQDVVIHGIRILNDLKVPNCDGIDPDHCRNVRISDCHIEAGDDCIVIKNTKEFGSQTGKLFSGRCYGPTENITVTNCTLISTSAAVKIGTESVDDFRDIVISNCVIKGSSRGLAIHLRDQGNVENVVISHCVVETRLFEGHWWGCAEPVYITAIHRFSQAGEDRPAWNPQGRLGQVRHVRVSDLLCRGENGVFIAADPPEAARAPATDAEQDSPDVALLSEAADAKALRYFIEDVVLDNVRVAVKKTSKWPGGKHDRRPCDALGPAFRDPSQDPGLREHTTVGVFVEHARAVTLRQVAVVWDQPVAERPTYFGAALETMDTPGLVLSDFSGEPAHPA